MVLVSCDGSYILKIEAVLALAWFDMLRPNVSLKLGPNKYCWRALTDQSSCLFIAPDIQQKPNVP